MLNCSLHNPSPFRDLDAFLCLSGPSLAEVRDSALHVPGAAVLAVGRAYPKIRPDVWIGLDAPECYAVSLLREPFSKLMNARYADDVVAAGAGEGAMQDVRLRDCPNVFFVEGGTIGGLGAMALSEDEQPAAERDNEFLLAVRLAFELGCRRVCLLGADLPTTNRAWGRFLEELPVIAEECQRSSRTVVSCTPDSLANHYVPFERLADALDRAAASVPRRPEGRPLEPCEAKLCRWGTCECDGEGVMTGADARTESLLPAWWESYWRWSDLSVAFADLGLSPTMRHWCAARGRVVELGETHAVERATQRITNVERGISNVEVIPRERDDAGLRHSSFLACPPKPWRRRVRDSRFVVPFCLLRSPFRRTLWLDVSCEVRGPLESALALAESAGLAAAADPYGTAEDALSSAVVAARHGEPAVREWAAQTLRRMDRLRDDAAALEEVREACPGRIAILPRGTVRLGKAGPSRLAVAYS